MPDAGFPVSPIGLPLQPTGLQVVDGNRNQAIRMIGGQGRVWGVSPRTAPRGALGGALSSFAEKLGNKYVDEFTGNGCPALMSATASFSRFLFAGERGTKLPRAELADCPKSP